MKIPARFAGTLLLVALASTPVGAVAAKARTTGDAHSTPAAESAAKASEAWLDRLSKGADPKTVAAKLPAQAITDLQALNALRLRLKSEGKEAVAQSFFAALVARKPTDEALLNLSLAYVDQMMGKNLLQQGNLSSRSQDAVIEIIKRNPKHWAAWYIRGLNNLYWPDWFRKAGPAQEYLAQAVALHEQLPPQEQDENDGYALGYLALGDAYALLDQPAEARKAWQKGVHYYPYMAALRERLAIPEGELHAKVRALRDADQPIDTDLAFLWKPLSAPFQVNLTSGTLFGPGPLVDQPLKPGKLAKLQLGSALNGYIPAFNNRGAEPNLPGEVLQGKTVDGLLSDGAEANENVDVGFVALMNGQFKLFLSAVQDGPSKGVIHFFLDDGWHWTIYDDIAIDPGFPVGVIKIQNFTWSTSPRLLPYSRQTEAKAPAGVDQSGSIKSGEAVPGRLGDDNFDGKLDGLFNAIGQFPYDSVILPGSPFSQIRVFETDIPVTSAQATWLTLANALSHLRLSLDLKEKHPDIAASLRKTFAERVDFARRHAEKASLSDAAKQGINSLKPEAGEAELCAAWKLLQQAAPASDLRRRDFNASGITLSATCASAPATPTAAK
jgi:hypothetical protein